MSDANIWVPGGDSAVIQLVVAALTSTSSSSVAIGAGSKTLTVGTNKLFIVGNWVFVVDTANPANYMLGQIIAYTASTGVLTINVPATAFNGSGTKTSWTVTVSGLQGVSGSLSGNVAGVINFLNAITMAQTLGVTGDVTLGGKLLLSADPTNALHAATKQYVDAMFPVGVIIDYAATGPVPNSNWLLCNGQAVNRITYAALFTAISTKYGVGDGTTTFNVPNLARRVTMGVGGTGTATIGNAVGNVGGEEIHTLTLAETPAHTHGIGSATGTVGGGPGTLYQISANDAVQSTSQGSNGGHNNIQPSMVMNKIIKAF